MTKRGSIIGGMAGAHVTDFSIKYMAIVKRAVVHVVHLIQNMIQSRFAEKTDPSWYTSIWHGEQCHNMTK